MQFLCDKFHLEFFTSICCEIVLKIFLLKLMIFLKSNKYLFVYQILTKVTTMERVQFVVETVALDMS